MKYSNMWRFPSTSVFTIAHFYLLDQNCLSKIKPDSSVVECPPLNWKVESSRRSLGKSVHLNRPKKQIQASVWHQIAFTNVEERN